MSDVRDPWLGKLIAGRYEVRRLIGKGGMGAVYEGYQAGLDRRVAIKFLIDGDMPAAKLERFRREARLASKVIDDHVAQVFDIGTTDTGHEYIVMEYVDGKDLASVISDEGLLPLDRVLAIASDMLEGLAVIHAKDILHRDVKPSNVLLTRRADGSELAKLADFGLARGADDATLTKTGHIVGTTPFMAPELFRGEEIDHRADLYAAGITVYQMLAGKLPFHGATAVIGAKHVYEPPPPLGEQRDGIPPHVIAAVERALAKAPADRFASATAFRDALTGKAPVSVLPATLAPPTVASRPRALAPAKEHRERQAPRWPWVLGALVIVGGGAIGAYLAQRERPAPAVEPVVAAVTSDAAVMIDATVRIDAGAVAAGSIDASLTTPVTIDAGVVTGHKPGTGMTRPKLTGLCRCLPTTGETTALCPKQGQPLCRCNDKAGKPLCPEALIPCSFRDRDAIQAAGVDFNEVCWGDKGNRCPDIKWDTFKRPGVAGAACIGWSVNRAASAEARPGDENVKTEGYLDCDACPGAETQTYRGVEGDPCTGYHWRTAKQVAGTLKHCE